MLLWLLNLDFAGGGVISRYTGPRPSDIARLNRKKRMLLSMEAKRLEQIRKEEELRKKAELELIALRKAEKQAKEHADEMRLQSEIAALVAKISALEGEIERLRESAERLELKAERTQIEIRRYRDNEAITALFLAGAI